MRASYVRTSAASIRHRHPGSHTVGYILEGTYEVKIDDGPVRTLKPGEVTDADIRRLTAQGWRDEQIFEAAFDASLFALFNRVAITYGLDYPPDGWQPPLRTALRPGGGS